MREAAVATVLDSLVVEVEARGNVDAGATRIAARALDSIITSIERGDAALPRGAGSAAAAARGNHAARSKAAPGLQAASAPAPAAAASPVAAAAVPVAAAPAAPAALVASPPAPLTQHRPLPAAQLLPAAPAPSLLPPASILLLLGGAGMLGPGSRVELRIPPGPGGRPAAHGVLDFRPLAGGPIIDAGHRSGFPTIAAWLHAVDGGVAYTARDAERATWVAGFPLDSLIAAYNHAAASRAVEANATGGGPPVHARDVLRIHTTIVAAARQPMPLPDVAQVRAGTGGFVAAAVHPLMRPQVLATAQGAASTAAWAIGTVATAPASIVQPFQPQLLPFVPSPSAAAAAAYASHQPMQSAQFPLQQQPTAYASAGPVRGAPAAATAAARPTAAPVWSTLSASHGGSGTDPSYTDSTAMASYPALPPGQW